MVLGIWGCNPRHTGVRMYQYYYVLVSSQLDKHSRLTKPNKQSGHAPCSIYSQGPCQGRACDCQLVAWIFGLRFQNSWPFVPSMMRLSTPTCYRSWRCINDFNIQRINLLYKKFRLHLTSQHLRFCFSIYFWRTWRRTPLAKHSSAVMKMREERRSSLPTSRSRKWTVGFGGLQSWPDERVCPRQVRPPWPTRLASIRIVAITHRRPWALKWCLPSQTTWRYPSPAPYCRHP